MGAALAVTLTVDQLDELIEGAVDRALAKAKPLTSSDVLTRAEVAELLGLHPDVVTRKVRTLGLPGIRLPGGGGWRFSRTDVLAWWKENGKLAQLRAAR